MHGIMNLKHHEFSLRVSLMKFKFSQFPENLKFIDKHVIMFTFFAGCFIKTVHPTGPYINTVISSTNGSKINFQVLRRKYRNDNVVRELINSGNHCPVQ